MVHRPADPAIFLKDCPNSLVINIFSYPVVFRVNILISTLHNPNFSNRRYSACRDRPNSRATSVMLPRYLCMAC